MPSNRTKLTIAAATGVVVVGLAFYAYQGVRAETVQIRARFEQMRLALAAMDTNVIRSLYPPGLRAWADKSILASFVEPLGPNSFVFLSGTSAYVHLNHRFLYGFIPGGGNAVVMTNVDGIWYFTGKVSID